MSQCDKHLFYYFHFQFLKYFPLSVTLYSRILEGSHKVTANVRRLENVAKMQHQAFTNITKTLN